MSKIKINMLSSADKVDGQGVGSAYLEQVALVRESKLFDVHVNDKGKFDIIHSHTIDPINYVKMKRNKGVNVAYVHFLPTTLDGSIKLPKPALSRRPSGLRKTKGYDNSLAHRTTWLRSDLWINVNII